MEDPQQKQNLEGFAKNLKQNKEFVKFKDLSAKLNEVSHMDPVASHFAAFDQNQKIKKLQHEYDLNNAKLKKSQNQKNTKKSFKSTIDRYNKKFAFGDTGKKKERKKKRMRKKVKKGATQGKDKELRSDNEHALGDFPKNQERYSTSQKFDFKKKKMEVNESINKIMFGLTFNDNRNLSKKNNVFKKKPGRKKF